MKTMVRAAYCPADLTEQKQHFEGLRALEDDNTQGRVRSHRNIGNNGGRNDRNRNKNDRNNDRHGNGPRKSKRNDNSEDHLDAICPIHGGHTIRECTLIRNKRRRYQERRGNSKNNNDQVRNNSNGGRRNYRYKTRCNTYRNEDNNNINENNKDDTEDDLSTMNNIYEEMNTVQQKHIRPHSVDYIKQLNPTLSEIHVVLASFTKMVLGLLTVEPLLSTSSAPSYP